MESLGAVPLCIWGPIFSHYFPFSSHFLSVRQVLKIKCCMSHYVIVLLQLAETLPPSTFLCEVTRVTLAMKSSSIEAHSTLQPKGQQRNTESWEGPYSKLKFKDSL